MVGAGECGVVGRSNGDARVSVEAFRAERRRGSPPAFTATPCSAELVRLLNEVPSD